MAKPRLLVLARELPESPGNLRYQLTSLLNKRVGGVAIEGSAAVTYTPEALIKRTVLGEETNEARSLGNIQRGCELYVGIRTPEGKFVGTKTKDGRFDRYQIGEIGFDLAMGRGIPAILLGNYDQRTICDFVQNNTQ